MHNNHFQQDLWNTPQDMWKAQMDKSYLHI
jgi:hypothetical protein